MQKITFHKKSIQVSFWDETAEDWQDRDISKSELPITWYLPYEVFVEEGVTIREVLTLLKPYSEQINYVFINYLKTVSFESLLESLFGADREDTLDDDVSLICMLWVGQVKPLDDEEDELSAYPTLMALDATGDEDSDEDEFVSIHEISITQLLDKPLIIDDLLEYVDDLMDSQFSGITSWSLFDFIRTLANELTTYSFVTGVFPKSELDNLPPLSSTELFEHMEDLDDFFKNKNLRD
jgi:hypothetical protein